MIIECEENPFFQLVRVNKAIRDAVNSRAPFVLRNYAARVLEMPQLLELSGSDEVVSDLRYLLRMFLKIKDYKLRGLAMFLEMFRHGKLQAIMTQVLKYIKATMPYERIIDYVYADYKKLLFSHLKRKPEEFCKISDLFQNDFTAFSLLTDNWNRSDLILLLMDQFKANSAVQERLRSLVLKFDESEVGAIETICQLFAHLIISNVPEEIWIEGYNALRVVLKCKTLMYCLTTDCLGLLNQNRGYIESMIGGIRFNNKNEKAAFDLLLIGHKMVFRGNISDNDIFEERFGFQFNVSDMKLASLFALKSGRIELYRRIAEINPSIELSIFTILCRLYPPTYEPKFLLNALSVFSADLNFEFVGARPQIFVLLFKYYELETVQLAERVLIVSLIRIPKLTDHGIPEHLELRINFNDIILVKSFISHVKVRGFAPVKLLLDLVSFRTFDRAEEGVYILSPSIMELAINDESFRLYIQRMSYRVMLATDPSIGEVDYSKLPKELRTIDTLRLISILDELETVDDFQIFMKRYSKICYEVYLDMRDSFSGSKRFIEIFFRFKTFFLYWMQSADCDSFVLVNDEGLNKLLSIYFPEKMKQFAEMSNY